MRSVRESTDGKVRLGPGTLCSSIKSLLEERLSEELDEREDPELSAGRRRYHRLTAAGRKLARSEAERLAAMVVPLALIAVLILKAVLLYRVK